MYFSVYKLKVGRATNDWPNSEQEYKVTLHRRYIAHTQNNSSHIVQDKCL